MAIFLFYVQNSVKFRKLLIFDA